MLELKVLIQKLKGYPENSFAYPAKTVFTVGYDLGPKEGLMVVDLAGNEQGFIETGGKEGARDK